jgi:tetratricopeptide (TPR) repeat protein
MRERLEAELSDRYVIERELGRGGMATVWLAHDRRRDCPVAIKVLHAEIAGAIGVDRFVREIRLTTRLQHPGIVPVLDSGVLPATTEVPLPWYAMSYVPGESLRARLARETQLPVDEAVRIARDVAETLRVAHAQGIVHRDIKPENIILADGAVYVIDFGIAKALSDTGDERLTSTGLAVGTPVYMSPEQATADAVDARTDQYSLAAVLHEMLVGEPPITGPNAQSIIARRLTAPVRPMRPVRPNISESLEAVVLRALERVPADRYPNIGAFIEALDLASVGSRRTTSLGFRPLELAAALLLVIAAVAAWRYAGSHTPARVSGPDSAAVTLYRRGMRAYDSRTAAGAREAIQAFNAAIARDSNFARGRVGLAKTYVRVLERRFDVPGLSRDSILRSAVFAADRAILADSTDAQAWVAQAMVRRLIDPADVQPVIRAARQAIALDSSDGSARHVLALSLAEAGHVDSAIAQWREAVRRQPTYTQGLAFLAFGYWWHKQFDSAAVWADSAVTVDPSYLLGRTALGQILARTGDEPRAIAMFEAARRLSDAVEVPIAVAGRALAELRAGRPAQARETMRQADSLASLITPTSLHTAVYLALTYAELGDADRAMAWLTRYETRDDIHYQLHLRCEPSLAAMEKDARFRALLLPGARFGAC